MDFSMLMKSIGTYAKAEIRNNIGGASVFGLFFTPLVIILVGKGVNDAGFGEVPIALGQYMMVSMVGGLAMLIMMQLSSEVLADRTSGVLLRARSLPNGPLSWAIAKAISVAVSVLIM